VLLLLTLGLAVLGDVGGLSGMLRQLGSISATIGRHLWLVDYAAARAAAEPTDPAAVGNVLREGIRLSQVCFSYPGVDKQVLADVDAWLPAGSTVALVGDNGAGKSTLVKLLCGFYQPTSGSITVDGTPLADLDVDAWRDRLSACFQDHTRYEFSLRESVGLGHLPGIDDAEQVSAALKRAAATALVDDVPLGLDTQLGTRFAQGTELSGGQWQMVALGRAFMRRQPFLLILDEPSSALDAAAEHTLFEHYSSASRAVAAKTGAITVLISHRFSTVRMADLILVVADGRITESGSHADLMRLGGTYAEMFRLQARHYSS
jgi:ATP-binding cassette subfamily B protein